MSAIAYDRVGAHGEPVPGCNNRTGMDVYRQWVESTFGFTFLGSCSQRTVTGGSNWSVHAVKRAADHGYPQNARQMAVRYLDYLTERDGARARILGVQALHDYAIGEDGSYGQNRARKRMWGHGQAVWRFGGIGAGWFWVHTELLVVVARSAPEMVQRLALLAAYDAALNRPPPPPEPDPAPEPSPPPEPPTREVPDMYIFSYQMEHWPGAATFRVSHDSVTHIINGPSAQVDEAAGVPHLEGTHRQMADLLRDTRRRHVGDNPFVGQYRDGGLLQLW